MDAVRAARAPDAPAVDERQVVLPGGVELELHVAGMRGRDGAATVVTLRDVTEQRRLERARRDLVANVSHELKTPIAALKGFLELLEDERVAPRDRRDFLAAMTVETARLERLVEEQLQLARLDAGALPLELEDVDLAQLVDAVVEARAALAEREGVALDAAVEHPGPLVPADAARIEQVLLILLDNAVRHTAAGGSVRVSVSAGARYATMAVRDTGEGIAPDDLPFIFDRFYRGDPSREGRSAGLGLAIARGLVAAHRGTITVDSALGEGTTFTVTLPLTSAGAVTREEPIPPGLAASPPGS
jgi:two-component system sensor histidine kinase ResE